jgi:hypothetical protein
VAFACVIGAGACTSLGAALAFCINLEVPHIFVLCVCRSCSRPETSPKFICGDRSTFKFVRGVLCRTSVFLPCRWPCHAASCFTFRWWRFSSNLLMLLGAVPLVLILGFRFRAASQKKCCKAALCICYKLTSPRCCVSLRRLGVYSSEYCPERVLGDACPHGYGATTGFFFLGLAITAGLNMLVSNLEYLCGKCGLTCFRQSETEATKPGQVEPSAPPASEFLSPAQASTDKEVLQPEAQPLPPGWEVRLMRGSMKPFFYHTKSKKFMWSFPGLSGDADCVCSASHTHSSDVEMSVECPQVILEVCKDKPVLGDHKQHDHKQQDSIQDSILEVQVLSLLYVRY